MTVEPEGGADDVALAAEPAPEQAGARPAPSPSSDEANRGTRAFQRRRAGALATVGLAALLALVGLLAPAWRTSSAASAREAVEQPAPPVQAAAPVTVLPPRPPSLLGEQTPQSPPTSETSAAPAGPPPPPKRAPRIDPVSTPATRTPTKQPSPYRPRASLSVRENPYARGFTHPTNLSERRK